MGRMRRGGRGMKEGWVEGGVLAEDKEVEGEVG